MLSALCSFLEFYVDPQFAEIVFDWNEIVLSIIGGITSIFTYFVPADKFSKKIRYVLAVIVILLFSLLIGYSTYCKQVYTKLPDINYKVDSYSSVLQKLTDVDLQLKIDHDAQAPYEQNPDLSSSCFRVLFMSPEPGSLQKKGSSVTLYVIWSDKVYNKDSSTPHGLFSNQQLDSIPTFHTSQFTLYLHSPHALLLTALDSPLFDYTYLSADKFDQTVVTVSLFDYTTKQCIQSRQISLGQSLDFTELPSGTYYYTAVADGYYSVVSEHPFRLDSSSDALVDTCDWELLMEPTTSSFSSPSKVQLVDSQNQPLSDVSAELRLDTQDGSLIDSLDAQVVHTDENGMVCSIFYLNSESVFYPLSVSVSTSYVLTASLSEQNTFYRGYLDHSSQTWIIQLPV